MNKYYTGIGSRSTPIEFELIINKLALKLQDLGYILRSGGADGADTFFEKDITNKEIYIPWENFNDRTNAIIPSISEFKLNLLKDIHPNYDKLSSGARKLHLRNINQVLGKDEKTPSKFLICYADFDQMGIPMGGTRTAWVLAKKYNVACFNIKNKCDLDRILKFIGDE